MNQGPASLSETADKELRKELTTVCGKDVKGGYVALKRCCEGPAFGFVVTAGCELMLGCCAARFLPFDDCGVLASLMLLSATGLVGSGVCCGFIRGENEST